MTVVKDVSSSVFEGRRSSAEVTSEGKPFHSRLEVQTRFLTVSGLERRTTSLWLDADRSRLRESSSTARASAHCKSLARYSGGVLLGQRNQSWQWVMGQMGQQIWVGHVGHGSVPVTRWRSSRDFLVHWKPATAIKTVMTVSTSFTICNQPYQRGQRRPDNFGNTQISIIGRPKFCWNFRKER